MKTIEVIVGTSGEVQIDSIGFKGADCEQATKFLEEALGVVGQKVRKPEYYQSTCTSNHQKLGG